MYSVDASYTSLESLLSLCELYPRQTESGPASYPVHRPTNQPSERATTLLVTKKRESASVVLIPVLVVTAAAAANSEGLRPMLYEGACLLLLKATPLPNVVGG